MAQKRSFLLAQLGQGGIFIIFTGLYSQGIYLAGFSRVLVNGTVAVRGCLAGACCRTDQLHVHLFTSPEQSVKCVLCDIV